MVAVKMTNRERKPAHKARMVVRRARQRAAVANASAFGRKLVRIMQEINGVPTRVSVGVERMDEQGAYRFEHWRKK